MGSKREKEQRGHRGGGPRGKRVKEAKWRVGFTNRVIGADGARGGVAGDGSVEVAKTEVEEAAAKVPTKVELRMDLHGLRRIHGEGGKESAGLGCWLGAGRMHFEVQERRASTARWWLGVANKKCAYEVLAYLRTRDPYALNITNGNLL